MLYKLFLLHYATIRTIDALSSTKQLN